MRKLLVVMVALSGCVTATRMNKISTGMSKSEVIAAIGEPASVSAQRDDVTYLNYRFPETDWDWWVSNQRPYFVRIIDDKVESFGRQGDFDSTKEPTTKVKVETTASMGQPKQSRLDVLKQLNELRREGALTEEEFQAQKARVLKE